MHIAIIGCGISGLLTALEMLQQGCSVTLFDQQQAGKAASWAGGGILSPMYPWRYPKEVNQLAQYGKALYQSWNEKLKPHTEIDFEIQNSGLLIFDEADFKQGLSYAKQFDEPMQFSQKIDQQQIHALNPQVSEKFKEALYFPRISNIRNPRLLKSIIEYLKQHPKVRIYQNTWIDRLNIRHQSIQSIQNQCGEIFYADHFIITTGAWSEHWSKQLDCSIPVKPVQGQMLLFKSPQNWLTTMCMNEVMYLIPRQDGHIVCGSSMEHLGFDKRPKVNTQQKIYHACTDIVPELKKLPIVKQWAGLRPSSPDGIPYIGQMPNFENLWANFGHFRNGLCMGPASARLLKQLIFKLPTIVDASAYSPTRLNTQFAMANS